MVKVNLFPVKKKRRNNGSSAKVFYFVLMILVGIVLGIVYPVSVKKNDESNMTKINTHVGVFSVSEFGEQNKKKCLFGRVAEIYSYKPAMMDSMPLVELKYAGARQEKMPHFVFASSLNERQLQDLTARHGSLCFQLARDDSGFVNLLPVNE